MKDGVVELPGLRDKLPPEHGLAGRTPLEIMAASSEKRMAEGFTNRTGYGGMIRLLGQVDFFVSKLGNSAM